MAVPRGSSEDCDRKTTGNLTLKHVRKRCLEIKNGERLERNRPR
jgi:hypothetical protein